MWMDENELPDRISFLTFNAGLLEYRICGVKLYQNPPYTSHRLLQIPSALRGINADIIALQEVFDEKHSDYIIESLQPVYPYFARESRRSSKNQSLRIWKPISVIHNQLALHNGLLVLSKYPILSARFTCFSDVTLIEEWFVSKGMLEVTIELPGMNNSPITLFNIHMASGAVNPESKTIETLRNKEIEQLLGACDHAIRRGEVPVIIGDLNAAPNCCGSNYNYFTDRGWRDCFECFRVENKYSTSASSNISSHINIRSRQNGLDYKGKQRYIDMEDLYDDLSSHSKENFTHREEQTEEEEHLTPSSNDSFSTRIDIDTTPMINMNVSTSNINKGNDDVAVVNKLVSSFAVAKAAVEAAKKGFSSCSPESTNIEVVSTTKSSNCSNNMTELQDDYPIKQYFAGSKEYNNSKLFSPDYTWDPNNPLNVIGPHSNCRGLRCDHIFLPPTHLSKKLAQYEPHKSSVILREPRVLVDGWCFGCVGSTVLVTLSDHYGVYVELKRKLDDNCRNSQY